MLIVKEKIVNRILHQQAETLLTFMQGIIISELLRCVIGHISVLSHPLPLSDLSEDEDISFL